MQLLRTVFIISVFSFLGLKLFSQNPIIVPGYDCGLQYYYDNAGNRILRSVVICGGNTRMLQVDSTQSSQDSVIAQIQLELLYPNPTSGPVNIVFNTLLTDAQVTVIDNQGKQLYSATVSGTNVPLDLSNLAQGIYYVTVKTEGNTFNSNIVKQ